MLCRLTLQAALIAFRPGRKVTSVTAKDTISLESSAKANCMLSSATSCCSAPLIPRSMLTVCSLLVISTSITVTSGVGPHDTVSPTILTLKALWPSTSCQFVDLMLCSTDLRDLLLHHAARTPHSLTRCSLHRLSRLSISADTPKRGSSSLPPFAVSDAHATSMLQLVRNVMPAPKCAGRHNPLQDPGRGRRNPSSLASNWREL
jgi:hypothetical protein